jgi:hypothetical protein
MSYPQEVIDCMQDLDSNRHDSLREDGPGYNFCKPNSQWLIVILKAKNSTYQDVIDVLFQVEAECGTFASSVVAYPLKSF